MIAQPTNGTARMLWALLTAAVGALSVGATMYAAYNGTRQNQQAESNAAQQKAIDELERRVTRLEDCN